MIVCHCTGITDRDIRALVRTGRARTALAIGRAETAERSCSAGHGCGGCHVAIAQIVEQEERSREAVLVALAPAL